jgi:hypothetical protein
MFVRLSPVYFLQAFEVLYLQNSQSRFYCLETRVCKIYEMEEPVCDLCRADYPDADGSIRVSAFGTSLNGEILLSDTTFMQLKRWPLTLWPDT